MRSVLVGFLLLVALASTGLAHGARYEGLPLLPPRPYDPKDPSPPPPDLSSPDGPPILPPGTRVEAPPSPDAHLRPPPEPRALADSFEVWWGWHRDAVLDLPRGEPLSSPARGGALAALRRAFDDAERREEVRAAAVVALARGRAEEDAARLLAAVRGDPGPVRDAAVLGLGLHGGGGDEATEALFRIAVSPDEHRRPRFRALVALGLRDGRIPEFLARVAEAGSSWCDNLDVAIAVPLAAGISGRREAVPVLLTWLEDRRAGDLKLADLERSFLAWALGRLDAAPAAESLSSAGLRGRGIFLRRSAAIALGRIVPLRDAESRAALAAGMQKALANESDPSTRDFLCLALGRIGAADPDLRPAIAGTLARELEPRNDRGGFAALGLARLGPEHAGSIAARIGPTGAFAIAAGLAGDARPGTVSRLRAVLRDEDVSAHARSAAAVGLGLLGVGEARADVRALLADRDARSVLPDAAVALRLVGGDPVPDLVDLVADRRSSVLDLLHAADALGDAGDGRAVSWLAAVLEESPRGIPFPGFLRVAAARSLGRLLDPPAGGGFDRLFEDLNHRAGTPLLDELPALR